MYCFRNKFLYESFSRMDIVYFILFLMSKSSTSSYNNNIYEPFSLNRGKKSEKRGQTKNVHTNKK